MWEKILFRIRVCVTFPTLLFLFFVCDRIVIVSHETLITIRSSFDFGLNIGIDVVAKYGVLISCNMSGINEFFSFAYYLSYHLCYL